MQPCFLLMMHLANPSHIQYDYGEYWNSTTNFVPIKLENKTSAT